MNEAIYPGISLREESPSSAVAETLVPLSKMKVGAEGRIFSVTQRSDMNEKEIIKRFMRLGFLRGETVRVIQKAPFFQSPILVQVRGARIALSDDEAELVQLESSQCA